MRNLFIICTALFTTALSQAQLRNGNFELRNSIPISLGDQQALLHWSNAQSSVSTVDYYSSDAGSCCDWPETPYGIVTAHSQKSFVGLALCGKVNSSNRTYLQQIFETPLESGKKYKVSLFVSNGTPTAVSTSGLATSDLGFYFSEYPVQQTQNWPLLFEPQFKIDTVWYSSQWKQISFVFTPTTAVRCMTIGVFGNNALRETSVRSGTAPELAYYFFDDVSVTLFNDDKKPDFNDTARIIDELKPGEVFVPNSFSPNNDGQNDIFTPIGNQVFFLSLKVMNRWGEVLFDSSKQGYAWDGMNSKGEAPTGTYVWILEYTSNILDSEMKTKQGFVNLLR
ncbi:MAG: hypothetical protein RIR06_788 [Bacteroidota bacterium]|jgi:gliding motility-associated-like protein